MNHAVRYGVTSLLRALDRWGRPVGGVVAALGVCVLVLQLVAPSGSVLISPRQIAAEQGRAFVAPIDRASSRFFAIVSDGIGSDRASTLVLLEDGRPLGPAHATHESIRAGGAGRYSHWGNGLWFSTPDGSDPRTNGRIYRAEFAMSLRPKWKSRGIALLIIGVATFFAASRRRSGGDTPRRFMHGLQAVARGGPSSQPLVLACVAAGAAAGVAAVVGGWYWGDTPETGLAVARFLPVSDAFGYHRCATAISLTGSFDEPISGGWCSRRALYPALLASLLTLTGWSSQAALIVQGALIGAAITAFAWQTRARLGSAAAVAGALLLAVYAWEFALGLFMTEVAGLVLGLGGLALLLREADRGPGVGIFIGIACISIGMAARAGALFALPALVLWATFAFAGRTRAQRVRAALAASAAALVGPALQFLFVWGIGSDPFHTGSNFGASLYGLSTGSRDWTEAYRVFDQLFRINEGEAFRAAYRAAIENIRARPEVFLGALSDAFGAYLDALYVFGDFGLPQSSLRVLAGIGLVLCVAAIRQPHASLLVVLALAEMLAAPLIFDSGGNRVFAVTVGVRFLLVAVSVQWILQLTAGKAARTDITATTSLRRDANALLPGLVLALMLLAVTPLSRALRPVPAAVATCEAGQDTVVARVGVESQAMHWAAGGQPVQSLWPFVISRQRLAADRRIGRTWFGEDFFALEAPISVVRAVDLQPAGYGTVHPVIITGPVAEATAMLLCIDRSKGRDLAGTRHFAATPAPLVVRVPLKP